MDLLNYVATSLKIEEDKAERGVGAILMALRMSLPKDTFEKLKQAVPNCESMMGRALMSASRTGEMLVVTGPSALLAALAAAGISKEDVPRLGRLVLERVKAVIGAPAVSKFQEMHPALKA